MNTNPTPWPDPTKLGVRAKMPGEAKQRSATRTALRETLIADASLIAMSPVLYWINKSAVTHQTAHEALHDTYFLLGIFLVLFTPLIFLASWSGAKTREEMAERRRRRDEMQTLKNRKKALRQLTEIKTQPDDTDEKKALEEMVERS